MEHIRITPPSGEKTDLDISNNLYDNFNEAINSWWVGFFDSSIKELLSGIKAFFEQHKGSPFPMIAHVTPPQDQSDARYFLEALQTIGVPVVEKKIHHIQQNEMILFHPSSPPSDIPRVLEFFRCINPNELFQVFIDNVLRTFFSHGITPQPAFVGELRSLYFDKYRSFSYLVNLVQQTAFAYIENTNSKTIQDIFEFDESQFVDQLLQRPVNSKYLPTTAVIKLRVPVMDLAEKLFQHFGFEQYLFTDVDSIDEFWTSNKYKNLLERMKSADENELNDFLMTNSGPLSTIFQNLQNDDQNDKNKSSSRPNPVRSRKSRQLALMNQVQKKQPLVDAFETIISKVFRAPPESSPNVFRICEAASFNPRGTLNDMLLDDKSKSDTAIAYQLLLEQDKIVSIANWMKAFSARVRIKDKAILLSRFQVAVSDLEYLGLIDKKTRKPGTFRRILRV